MENVSNTEKLINYAFDFSEHSSGLEKLLKGGLAFSILIGAGIVPVGFALICDGLSALVDRVKSLPLATTSKVSEFLNKKVTSTDVLINYHLLFQTGNNKHSLRESIAGRKALENKLIFIPLLLESSLKPLGVDHFVVVTVDVVNKNVEYFDPKGVDPSKEQRSIKNYSGSLEEFLQTCHQAIGSRNNTIFNSTKIQSDYTSCGYYGSEFISRRAESNFEMAITQDMDINKIRNEVDTIHAQANSMNNSKSNESVDLADSEIWE